MNKKITVLIAGLVLVGLIFGGGIVTNTNQSAEFLRTFNRNASTDLDAAFYNPAGLVGLGDGFYLYVSNQTIFQTRTIESSSTALAPLGFPLHDEYVGDTKAYVFPNVYLTYKKDKLAVSGGLVPIGGGGSATYDDGLASFEALSVGLANGGLGGLGLGVSGYDLDAKFEGSSVYLGFQGTLAYAVNEMISVAAGGRYVMATNTYDGTLSAINFNTYVLQAPTMAGPNVPYDDVKVDVEQTATGFAPIVSVNLTPSEGVRVALRYEGQTALEFENETKEDGTGSFADGEKFNDDIPAMIAAGAAYQVNDALKAEASFTYYMNTSANWEGLEKETDNGYEAGVAFEYAVNEQLSASAGFLYSVSGAKDTYQNDQSYSLDAYSIAAGVKYQVNESMCLNLGVFDTFYIEGESAATAMYPVDNKYNKTAIGVGIGIGYAVNK
ncbi:OmpP1/FadL family transporter [Candidatus Neomarinimicrobiota bacterium]